MKMIIKKLQNIFSFNTKLGAPFLTLNMCISLMLFLATFQGSIFFLENDLYYGSILYTFIMFCVIGTFHFCSVIRRFNDMEISRVFSLFYFVPAIAVLSYFSIYQIFIYFNSYDLAYAEFRETFTRPGVWCAVILFMLNMPLAIIPSVNIAYRVPISDTAKKVFLSLLCIVYSLLIYLVFLRPSVIDGILIRIKYAGMGY